LTPATGARTTRFCRTQHPPPNASVGNVLPTDVWRRLEHRSSARLDGSRETRPALMSTRPTLPRPPHPALRSGRSRNAPRSGGTAGFLELICPTRKGKYFESQDWTTQITLEYLTKIAAREIACC